MQRRELLTAFHVLESNGMHSSHCRTSKAFDCRASDIFNELWIYRCKVKLQLNGCPTKVQQTSHPHIRLSLHWVICCVVRCQLESIKEVHAAGTLTHLPLPCYLNWFRWFGSQDYVLGCWFGFPFDYLVKQNKIKKGTRYACKGLGMFQLFPSGSPSRRSEKSLVGSFAVDSQSF